MRRNSLFFTSKEHTGFSGNEPIQIKKADKYGTNAFTWNTRFITLLDEYFKGQIIHNISDNTYDIMDKYVAYANGSLDSNDKQYSLIEQFNEYLAAIR